MELDHLLLSRRLIDAYHQLDLYDKYKYKLMMRASSWNLNHLLVNWFPIIYSTEVNHDSITLIEEKTTSI